MTIQLTKGEFNHYNVIKWIGENTAFRTLGIFTALDRAWTK